mmetsp:Transcript_39374/g.116745  ORF Transcript_39374/g.116745 Transcript_39374/m.116745 type:complete len:407 (+) Transcript_39374:1352-2572(+)
MRLPGHRRGLVVRGHCLRRLLLRRLLRVGLGQGLRQGVLGQHHGQGHAVLEAEGGQHLGQLAVLEHAGALRDWGDIDHHVGEAVATGRMADHLDGQHLRKRRPLGALKVHPVAALGRPPGTPKGQPAVHLAERVPHVDREALLFLRVGEDAVDLRPSHVTPHEDAELAQLGPTGVERRQAASSTVGGNAGQHHIEATPQQGHHRGVQAPDAAEELIQGLPMLRRSDAREDAAHRHLRKEAQSRVGSLLVVGIDDVHDGHQVDDAIHRKEGHEQHDQRRSKLSGWCLLGCGLQEIGHPLPHPDGREVVADEAGAHHKPAEPRVSHDQCDPRQDNIHIGRHDRPCHLLHGPAKCTMACQRQQDGDAEEPLDVAQRGHRAGVCHHATAGRHDMRQRLAHEVVQGVAGRD